MSKKTISLLLIIAIAVTQTLILSACEPPKSEYTLKFISTKLSSDGSSVEYPYKINMSNAVFSLPPSIFSAQLAKTSMVLSASSYDSEVVMQNLSILGFNQKAKFNYNSDYNGQHIGVAMASKITENSTIVAIVLRGTYNQEWYSNFDIGQQSNLEHHNGFFEASQFVLDKLNMYLTNYSIDKDNVRFMLTGHSRGGAVANLTASALIDKYSSDRVYAYTFATPNTTKSDDAQNQKYSGIFNFVNPEDFIAHIPLEKWGFTKYGTTINFPTKNTDSQYDTKLNKTSQYYKKYTKDTLKTFGSNEAVTDFLDTAYALCSNVDDYYNKKYEICGLSMSLYDYMMTVAYMLNNENVMTNGLILLSDEATAFEPITDFLLSGIEKDTLMTNFNYDDALIGYAHMPQTYLAWLDTYTENN